MSVKKLILLIVFVLPGVLMAQTGGAAIDSSALIINRLESGAQNGKVRFVQDPRLTRILRKHHEFNKTTGVPGYRILIYKGRELTKANQIKAEFEESFSHLNFRVNVEYKEPDFSTLVGAFRYREDAWRFKEMLSPRFPQTYIVPARITLE